MPEKIKEEKPENTGEKQVKRTKQDTQFKPGQSGNPKGKPKGTISITSKVKELLQKMAKTQSGEEKERLETLVINILYMAINERNEAMIKLIWNYVDGLPKQSLELSGEIAKANVSDKELADYKRWRKSRI